MKYRRGKVKGGTYFFTVVTYKRIKIFSRSDNVDLVGWVEGRNPTKTATSASRLRKNEKAIWQRRFWEHLIRDHEDLKRHVEYIHYNPVKHGLTKAPVDWRYSSFHRYVDKGMYDVNWGVSVEMKFDATVGYE